MSAFAPILVSTILGSDVLTSSATVAADKTYDPVGYIQPGIAKYEDRSSGISIGYPTFTLGIRPPTKGSRVTKVSARLSIPTQEAVSGANAAGITPPAQVAYACTCMLDCLLPERATAAEKTILLNCMISFLMGSITASDGSPVTATGTPLRAAIVTHERPY